MGWCKPGGLLWRQTFKSESVPGNLFFCSLRIKPLLKNGIKRITVAVPGTCNGVWEQRRRTESRPEIELSVQAVYPSQWSRIIKYKMSSRNQLVNAAKNFKL